MNAAFRAIQQLISPAALILLFGAACHAEERLLAGGVVEAIEAGCSASAAQRTSKTRAAAVSCLEYDYDGKDTLIMHHSRTTFNCCPSVITAEAEVRDNIVTIEQREEFLGTSPCRCLCTYDLRYRVKGVGAAKYHIKVREPYVRGDNKPLALDVPLLSASSGKHCVPRQGYPWSP